ncbi:sensor histidine kinase, partial [Methanohalophilus sp.]
NIIDETVANLKMKAKQKDINITYSSEIKNSKTYADRSQIKQIMYNLLSNAIKFTPEQGEIKVNSQFIDSKIQISVEDTGIGIPDEKYSSIFDPFKQVDSSTTREYEGTGLGLALVKKYVEMHGGDIWFESEVGKGSTFTFNIPSQLPLTEVNNKHP